MKLSIIFNSITTGAGALIGFLYGGWSMALTVLLTLVILDYLTGWLASAVEGKLSSAVGFKGIIKKVTIFVIVAVAHLVDGYLNAGAVLINASIFFYAANELLSIIENSGRIGLPVPTLLKKAVEILKEKSEVGK
jgi:toxin secretion/phage lysis holin